MSGAHAVDMNWVRTPGASIYMDSLFHRGARRQFGLLERPILPSQNSVNTIDFKIFVCGKSGVGKSATIAKLSGAKISNVFSETAGIETTSVYWPVFVSASNKVVFFRLNFWDVGDNVIKKFDHILPACMNECHCVLYLFSLTDRSSYEDMSASHLIARHSDDQNGIPPAKLIVATRADQSIHSDISNQEIHDLSVRLQAPIIRVKNINRQNPTMESDVADTSHFLNTLCNVLWLQEHKYNAAAAKRNVAAV